MAMPDPAHSRPVALELAIQHPRAVAIAAQVRATRVELCVALGATGGLTPSLGLIESVVAAARPAGVEVHPLIRPRPGGFVWTAEELDIQIRDVRAAVAAGADGVVVGALTSDGLVDTEALATLIEAADGREVTFHRALDAVAFPLAALDALVVAGVTRVLTSGGAARSIDGARQLAALARRSAGQIQIQAGGGVRPGDIAGLVAAGVDAVHLSAKTVVAEEAGPGGGTDSGYEVTDAGVAQAARDALDAATR